MHPFAYTKHTADGDRIVVAARVEERLFMVRLMPPEKLRPIIADQAIELTVRLEAERRLRYLYLQTRDAAPLT